MARGDHIYVQRMRGIYAHHGIDMGDGTVIDYNANSWTSRRKVQKISVEEFSKGDQILTRDYTKFYEQLENSDFLDKTTKNINKLMDKVRGLSEEKITDLSEDAVIQRAEQRLGESSFDIIFNNCEHFATWCKTGLSNSNQINNIWRSALGNTNFFMYRTTGAMTNLSEIPWKIFTR